MTIPSKLVVGLSALLACTGAAMAQQVPITGNMLGTSEPRQTSTSHETPEASLAHDVREPQVIVPEARSTALQPISAPTTASLPAAPPTGFNTHVAADHGIGSTTRGLLRMQANGQHAGRKLPILGDQAARSHQRYLLSFEHPIPVFFETSVKDQASSGN